MPVGCCNEQKNRGQLSVDFGFFGLSYLLNHGSTPTVLLACLISAFLDILEKEEAFYERQILLVGLYYWIETYFLVRKRNIQ